MAYVGEWEKNKKIKIVMLKGEKGDTGENGNFEDLTEEQKAELKADIRAFYQKGEGIYTTTGLTNAISIPIDGFRGADILFVDVEGLDLIQGRDYTISGNNIVLSTPIEHSGVVVHFVSLRASAVDVDDYSQLKGDKGDRGDFESLTNEQKDEFADLCLTRLAYITDGEIDTLTEG